MPKGSQIETTAAEPVKAPAAPAAPKAAAPKKAATPAAAAPKAAAPAAPAAAPAAATPAAPAAGPSLADLLEGSRRSREALEAIGRVEGLRRQRQIGSVEDVAAGPSTEEQALTRTIVRYPSMQSMTIPGESKPLRLGGTAPAQARVVAPTRTPTPADLTKTRNELASEAKLTGERFTSAIAAYGAAAEKISNKIGSGEAIAGEMPVLAKRQREALQEVLNLAAQMREYGFVGTNDDLIRQFEPK